MSIKSLHLASISVLGLIAFAPQSGFAADGAKAEDEAQIVVNARLEKTARSEEKIAPNLQNIQAAEAIAKYPDYNAAEALSRIPGVSLSIDTGEGRFVNIRGIDSNLNGATFGGAPLLNTQAGGTAFSGNGRAVEFDTIPAGSIDRLVVTKTGLPDHEAEGIGGSVELTPRSALTHSGFFFEGQLGEGYETRRKTTNLTEEVAFGDSFGDNGDGGKLLHIVVAQNEHNDARGFDDIEIGNYADSFDLQGGPITFGTKTADKVVSSYELRRYQYHRERFGYYSEVDITPNDDHRIYLRGSMAGYQERVNRQRLIINGLDGSQGTIAVDPANPNGFAVTGASADNTLRDEKETHRNVALQIGGEHEFEKLKLDWSASYIQATYNKPYDYNSTFVGPGDYNAAQAFNVNYDNISNSSRPLLNVNGANLTDPTQYHLASIYNNNEYAKDAEYSYRFNAAYEPGLTHDDEIKIGGELRYRHKYDLVGQKVTYSATGQTLASLTGNGPFTSFYGAYNIGYAGNAAALESLFNATASLAPLAAGTPILGNSAYRGGTFDDVEDITAGYVQYHGHIGALGLLAGVRVEHTKSLLGGLQYNQSTSYTNWFPTVQLRYEFTPRLVARATYSTGIARPGFLQTIQDGSVDDANKKVTLGNPNLKPATSNNFDVSLEYYLPDDGIVSLGFFDKEIQNYIAPRVFYALPPAGGAALYQWTSFQNAQSTYVRGVELQYVNRFKHLPAPFDGLGIDANGTFADSSVVLASGAPSVRMPGTGRFTANTALFYEAHRVESRLSLKYDDRTIFGIGGAPTSFVYASIPTDVYLDHRLTLDYTGSYQATSIVKVYWSVKNITNAPLRYYEGNSDRPIQREYYGQTFEAGVKVKF